MTTSPFAHARLTRPKFLRLRADYTGFEIGSKAAENIVSPSGTPDSITIRSNDPHLEHGHFACFAIYVSDCSKSQIFFPKFGSVANKHRYVPRQLGLA